MSSPQLKISLGQCTDKGHKPVNQDFHGLVAPQEPLLTTKGIAMAMADGISSSDVSQIASATSVKSFLEDYFATPETWSVKLSVQRVLSAMNSWLHAQTSRGPDRYNMDKGYVCTFSALIFKSTTAYMFHVGDTRVCRVSNKRLEQLSNDHREKLSSHKSYLSRALGMRNYLDVDYQTYSLEIGDTFVVMTDGIYEFVKDDFIVETIKNHPDDLDKSARLVLQEALKNGSDDNLTIQIVRIDQLPNRSVTELHEQVSQLPFPPELRPRMQFDGYEIRREIHHSSHSHIYLAIDIQTKKSVAIKIPSVELRNDAAYLESFLMEEWVARRLNSAHLMKHLDYIRKRNYLYLVTEYIEGQTLSQWMVDNPGPAIEKIRDIVGQIAKGLYVMHKQEMLHQDLRPNNVMIDASGTVKIIDFGSVRVAGLAETKPADQQHHLLGTAQYTAPEYFLGEPGTTRSDQFSLGVITYQLLSGRLPYGTGVARAASQAAQKKLRYQSVLDAKRTMPIWIDAVLRKAVHINPYKRFDEISEFIHNLSQPSAEFIRKAQPPLLEKNPVMFWQIVSVIQLIVIFLLYL